MRSPQASAKPTYIHATAVLIGQAGILIRGPSGAGKSSLALALLAEAEAIASFGRLIGDDRICVARRGESLILSGHPAIRGKIEQRGHGILDMPWEHEAPAHYVIDLPGPGSPMPRIIAGSATCLAGVTLPLFTLPLAPSASERAKFVFGLLRGPDEFGELAPFSSTQTMR